MKKNFQQLKNISMSHDKIGNQLNMMNSLDKRELDTTTQKFQLTTLLRNNQRLVIRKIAIEKKSTADNVSELYGICLKSMA